MAARPKNPPPDRRQEILDVALRLFSTKGYKATTNAEIAREAGVTSAALYYYFPSKADMFRAAFTERRSAMVGNVEHTAGHLLEMKPDVIFPAVLQALSGFVTDERSQAIMRLVLLEGPRNPELMDIYQNDVIHQTAPVVMKYIEHQMDQGRLRSMDPRILFLLLASPLVFTVLVRDILKIELLKDLTNEQVAGEIAHTILPALLGPNKE
jgi:AcrR family transcriptional regulator